MNIEAWDGTTWNLVANLAIQATGWNTYAYDVSSFIYNTNELTLRFRAESGGASYDYAQDLLLDDVKVQEAPTYGCTDPNATNYDATVDIEDGSCTYLNGCMDASAFNYDPSATMDDGSCYFCGCTDFTLNLVDSWGDGWNGNTWSANNAATGESVGPFTILSGYTGTATFCLSAGNWDWTAGGGSYASEISWDLLDPLGNIVTSGAGAGTGTFVPSDVLGCTDASSNNFDCSATVDDGSCLGLYLTGIIDFTVPGGGNAGKAIHVTAATDISDLSVFGIGVANNGGGTDGQEYTFDAISVLAGEHILVARDTAVMLAYFADCSAEFDHVLIASSDISQNGDDAIELFLNGSVVETFGEIDVDGTNDPWEYMDSWAYKNAGVGTVELFDLNNWSFGGVNCTDNTTTIYDASCPYPICPTLGCTDALASNYDATATVDNGSCLFATTFNVNMSCETASSFTTVSLESPVFGWCGGCVPMTDTDGDGTYSVTVDLPLGAFEYKYATDNFSGQEDLIDDMVNGGTCAPITDYYSYANREAIVASGYVANDTYGSCSPCLLPGCTDSTANNYDASYLTNDGSCTYDVTFSVDLRCSSLTPTVVTATGDYDNWSGNTYNLTDAAVDGIWEGTYSFA